MWPGSHHTLAVALAAAIRAGTGSADPAVAERWRGEPPRPPSLPNGPFELRMAAGDVVIAHPLLAHSGGQNFEAEVCVCGTNKGQDEGVEPLIVMFSRRETDAPDHQVRYMAFTRVSAPNHRAVRGALLASGDCLAPFRENG